MQILPAIDLRGGRAVRLVKGDLRKQVSSLSMWWTWMVLWTVVPLIVT